jgi:hypothetical protein
VMPVCGPSRLIDTIRIRRYELLCPINRMARNGTGARDGSTGSHAANGSFRARNMKRAEEGGREQEEDETPVALGAA